MFIDCIMNVNAILRACNVGNRIQKDNKIKHQQFRRTRLLIYFIKKKFLGHKINFKKDIFTCQPNKKLSVSAG